MVVKLNAVICYLGRIYQLYLLYTNLFIPLNKLLKAILCFVLFLPSFQRWCQSHTSTFIFIISQQSPKKVSSKVSWVSRLFLSPQIPYWEERKKKKKLVFSLISYILIPVFLCRVHIFSPPTFLLVIYFSIFRGHYIYLYLHKLYYE